MKRIAQLFASIAAAALLAACSAPGGLSAYEAGLKANVDQYKLFSDAQLAQLNVISTCYQYASNKSECSILMAGTSTTQTLAGQPKPLRVAKSIGEIFESITSIGLEKTVQIFGITAVRDAFKAQSDASAATSAAGIEAASKDPLVVDKPVIVQVPLGSAVLPTE